VTVSGGTVSDRVWFDENANGIQDGGEPGIPGITVQLLDSTGAVIELDPKHESAYSNLGIALSDQKKLDEAVAAYRRAIELDPKYAVAYSNLGNALHAQNKLDESVAAYKKAIELDPKYAPAYSNLGAALSLQKKLDEAVAAHKKAIELDPKYADAYYNLGLALSRQNKPAEALAAFRRAFELDPKNPHANRFLGMALTLQVLPYRDKKDAAGCLAVAAEYETLKLTGYVSMYNAACIRAHCASAILEDPRTPPADAARLAKEQADLAMAWLHKAVAAGFKNAAHMKQDKDLDALRDREDFKKLAADLEAKKK
jgi:superkiller protein 3